MNDSPTTPDFDIINNAIMHPTDRGRIYTSLSAIAEHPIDEAPLESWYNAEFWKRTKTSSAFKVSNALQQELNVKRSLLIKENSQVASRAIECRNNILHAVQQLHAAEESAKEMLDSQKR